MNELVHRFMSKRCISSDLELNKYIEDAAEIIELSIDEVDRLIEKHVDSLGNYPAFQVLYDMYKKCEEFTSGALATFMIAHIGSAEALCRTAIESSVNLHYVSMGDDLENILAYFKNYLVNERSQNRLWQKSVENSDVSADYKKYHLGLIIEKDKALNEYEKALRGSLAASGINYDSYKKAWPSTFDRFAKIDKEIEYRTIYIALCSQAHNDPEDVLNKLMSRIIPVKNYAKTVEVETYSFSLYMVLMSIQYYIDATYMFLAKYEINVTEKLVPLRIRVAQLTIDHHEFSQNHMKSLIKKSGKK